MSPLLARGRSRRAPGTSPLTSTLSGLKGILDSVEANIFVADLDFVLVYANRAAVRTAVTFAHEIEDVFGIGLGELLFGSIHRFHKDPAAIERILRNPKNFPYRSTHRFGNVVLEGQINAVTDEAGTMLGYCIAWEDVTEQERIEETAREVAAQLAAASAELTGLGATLDENATATASVATATAALVLAEISRMDAVICSVAVAATPDRVAVAVACSSSVAPRPVSSALAAANWAATWRAVSSTLSCSVTSSQAMQ